MTMGDMDTQVSLTTVCGGALDEAFKELYPQLVSAMKQGDKASLAITVGIEKMKDSEIMFGLSFSIKPNFPARSKASLCVIGKDNTLLTDKPVQKPEVISLFQKEAK
jgi:hypothetical protein